MKKYLLLLLLVLLPIGTFAENNNSDTDAVIAQMKSILDQYGARVKMLETENAVLRNEIMKAGIKIPLSSFSGVVVTNTSGKGPVTFVISTPNSASGTENASVTGAQVVLNQIAVQYSPQYAGFITRINADWPGIQSAYKLASGSYISGFEFVKKGNNNNVFVGVTYPSSTASGIFDGKILYEYHTGTFQRKLIGFFEFDKKTGYYVTRTGNNPFSGVERTFIVNPFGKNFVNPGSNTLPMPVVSTSSGSQTGVTITTMADIEKAYGEKRYLTAISLSNAYLQLHPTSLDLLRIRYRTFFIIGKYNESLSEIAKIESLGSLDKTVACDAQVIATYGKNQSLVDSYTKICGKK